MKYDSIHIKAEALCAPNCSAPWCGARPRHPQRPALDSKYKIFVIYSMYKKLKMFDEVYNY